MSRSPSAISDGTASRSSRRNSVQPPPSLLMIPHNAFVRTNSQTSAQSSAHHPPLGPSSNPPSASPSPRLQVPSHISGNRSASASSQVSMQRRGNPHDLSTQSIATRQSARVNDSHHPRFTNFRGYVRCRWCQAFTPDDDAAVDAHELDCPFAPSPCPLVDTETHEPCTVIAKGKQMLAEHVRRCPLRTIACSMRCGAMVSVQSMARHLAVCSQELVVCVACRSRHPRSAEAEHESHCPDVVVDCPLGCGVAMRRADVPRHVRETASTHSTRFVISHTPGEPVDAQLPANCPAVVISMLLDKIHELERKLRQATVDDKPKGGSGGQDESPQRERRDEAGTNSGGAAATPQRNPADNSTYDISPFSPKDRTENAISQLSVSVFAALVPPAEVARVSMISDSRLRVAESYSLTEVLLDALRAHDTKAKVLDDEDVASGRASIDALRLEVDAALLRAQRVWRISGLDAAALSSIEAVPEELKALRELAAVVQRSHLAVKCALYDCL